MAGNAGSTAFVSNAEAMLDGKVPSNLEVMRANAERFREEFIFPYVMASLYEGRGQLSEALECVKEAERRLRDSLELNPLDPKAEMNLCHVQTRRELLEAALPP